VQINLKRFIIKLKGDIMKKVLVVILAISVSAAVFAVDSDTANKRMTQYQQKNSEYHQNLIDDAALLKSNSNDAQYRDIVIRINALQRQIFVARDTFSKNPTQARLDELTRMVSDHDKLLQELNQFIQSIR
jgi:hypothetical protein